MKIRRIFFTFLIFSRIISHDAVAQKTISDKIIFDLLVHSDPMLINAKRIFLVKKSFHCFDTTYFKPALDSVGIHSVNYEKFQIKIDSVNYLNEVIEFKNRRLKIFPDNKKAYKLLSNQLNEKYSEDKWPKYVRLKRSSTIEWNKFFLVPYSTEFGGLSGRVKMAIIKKNHLNTFELVYIYRLPGGS